MNTHEYALSRASLKKNLSVLVFADGIIFDNCGYFPEMSCKQRKKRTQRAAVKNICLNTNADTSSSLRCTRFCEKYQKILQKICKHSKEIVFSGIGKIVFILLETI